MEIEIRLGTSISRLFHAFITLGIKDFWHKSIKVGIKVLPLKK